MVIGVRASFAQHQTVSHARHGGRQCAICARHQTMNMDLVRQRDERRTYATIERFLDESLRL
jgi:hypothetical protein